MAKYINPFTDWGFKRIFGQEFSKDLLISFLNDLFEGEFCIKDVTFKDKEQLAETKDLRGCIFDIYCETDTGKHFIVEMQNRWVPFFINRSVYYASRAIASQRKRTDYGADAALYKLLPVYVVCIMNFMPKDGEVDKFRTDVALREKASEAVFSDKLRFVYLSLPFFDKKEEKDCTTDFEKWIYILKHMEALERMPFTAQKKIFKRLADLADIKCLSQEDQEKYDESRKVADDYYSGLYGSYINGLEEGESKGLTKGLAQGMAKGLAKGMAKGMANGLAKGMAQGEQKKSRDIALKMLEAGMSSAQIIVFTGLSEEELKSLK